MHDFSGMDMGAPPIRVTRAGLLAELAGLRKRVAILRTERKEKQRQIRLKEAEQLRFRIVGLLRRINQIEKALKTMDKRRPPPRRRPPPPPPVRTRLRAPIPVNRPPPPPGRPVIPLSYYNQPSPFREGESGGPTGPGTEEIGPSAPFPSEGRSQEIEEMEAGQGQSASSGGRSSYRASEQEAEAGGAASAPAPSIWTNPLVWGLGILGVGAAIYFGTKGDAAKPDTGRKGAGSGDTGRGAGSGDAGRGTGSADAGAGRGAGSADTGAGRGAGSGDAGRGTGSADAGAGRGAGSADTGAGRGAGRSAGTSGAGA